MDKTSKVENLSVEYKKLALRCKTLEAQLRQSIPKKEHHEVVSKLEKEIDGLEKEIDRSNADQQRVAAFNKQIAGIGDQITSENKMLAAQSRVIESLAAKISQGNLSATAQMQTLNRVRELEDQLKGTVSKEEHASLQRRYDEMSRQVGGMVPSVEFYALKQKYDETVRQVNSMVPSSEFSTVRQRCDELERTISSMVPRDALDAADARARELEVRLSEHVPQSIYDELVGKVVALAEEVTGGALTTEGSDQSQQEAVEETVTAADAPQGEPTEVAPQEQSTESVETPSVFEQTTEPASDITEIQYQLAELNASANEATDQMVAPATEEAAPAAEAPAEEPWVESPPPSTS